MHGLSVSTFSNRIANPTPNPNPNPNLTTLNPSLPADLQDVATRNRVLSALAQTLNDVAHDHSVAVVVTNHITTRVDRGGGGGGGAASR